MNDNISNNKGVTLLELMISIGVGSLLMIMLIQVLMLSLAAKNQLAQDTRLSSESYVISESIEYRIFNLEPQELELMSDTVDRTVIELRHLFDYTVDPATGAIIPDTSNPITDILILEKSTGIITYNGVQLNDPSIRILDISSIELISIDPVNCDLGVESCEQGLIKLTLVLEIVLPNGHPLEPQTFITTILV